jgi:hypothetical protein
MLLRCKALSPSLPEAHRLGRYYRAGKQEFAVSLGKTYLVYGLRTWGAGIWVDIETDAGYLHIVPLALFEIVDGGVPQIWEIRVDEDGDCSLSPRAFQDPYFIDDLVEGKPQAVMEFRHVKAVLLGHAERETRPDDSGTANQ